MKQHYLLALLFFMLNGLLHGQEIIPMENGLPGKVFATCFDSLGHLYAVHADTGQTIAVKKWKDNERKWELYASMQGSLLDDFFEKTHKTTCHFLYGKLILTGVSDGQEYTAIYQYDGTWTKIARVKHSDHMGVAEWANFGSYKLNNKIYYSGTYDSFAGIKANVIVFDGSSFSNAGNFSNLNQDYIFSSKNDSLLLLGQNAVLAYKSGTWSTLYKTSNFDYFNGMALDGNDIIVSTRNNGWIKRIRDGVVIDSAQAGVNRPILYAVGDKILVSPQSASMLPQTVYQLNSQLNLEPVFVNQRLDTMNLYFTALNNKAYVWGKKGIFINAFNYNHIAEINLDSLKKQTIDTLRIEVFRDVNTNGIKDGAEYGLNSNLREVNSGRIVATGDQGILEVYHLNNENPGYEFIEESILDSCYRQGFSGTVGSRTYLKSRTRDTLYIPLRRTSLNNRNVVLKAYSNPRARLNTGQNLYFDVYNQDCNATSSACTLHVVLDSLTSLNYTNPAFSARNGNVLTFNLNVNAYQTKQVQVNVAYSNSNFVIGQEARHQARISMPFSEDSSDNADIIKQKMVYSYDPNVKYSEPEGKIKYGLKRIRYFIEFQNEGNDDAWRVTVVDTLNLKMPVVYFQMVGSSHPYTVSHVGNVMTWVFNNIYLKPKSVDEAGSKGYLVFDAVINSELRVGDSIRNKASIYFDYNEPIHTKFAVVQRVDDNDNIKETFINYGFRLYPNPGHTAVYLQNMSKDKHKYIIYTVSGQQINSIELEPQTTGQIDISKLASGIYLVLSDSGACLKFIKE